MENWENLKKWLEANQIWEWLKKLLKKVVFWEKAFAQWKAKIENMPDNNMPNWFGRLKVIDKNGKLVASFFTLEKGGKVDFMTRENSPQNINFWQIYNDKQKLWEKVALIIAGAFSPDYKIIEWIAYENGQKRWQNIRSPWNGLLVIKNGNPEIMNLEDIIDLNSFKKQIVQGRWSMFQQIQVIRNWIEKNINAVPIKWKFRFFVERYAGRETSRGIVNFSESMTFSDAINILKDIKIKNALYLDGGLVSEWYFYDKNKKSYLIKDEKFQTKFDGYTNLLIFYSQ